MIHRDSWRLRLTLAAVAVLVGAMVGTTFPPPARAAVSSLGLYIYPGTASAYFPITVTCGWHDECTAGNYNKGWGQRGIDFQNSAGEAVFFRSRNYRHDVYSMWGGTMTTVEDVGQCDKLVSVHIVDRWNVSHGVIEYRHTTIFGGVSQTFDWYAGNGSWVDEEGNGGNSWSLVPVSHVQIGTSDASCYLAHVHQQAERFSSMWIDNKSGGTAYPFASWSGVLNAQTAFDAAPLTLTEWQATW